MAAPETATGTVSVVHEGTVSLPADAVYALIADVARWPVLFGPTVHVEHLERGGGAERFRIWATAKGEVKNWTSFRKLDPVRRTIEFRQEVSQPPVARMGGYWRMEDLDGQRTRVVFGHEYRAIDDDPASLAWISEVVDHNSKAELASLEESARRGLDLAALTVSFEDSVVVPGEPAAVCESVYRHQDWRGMDLALLPPRHIAYKRASLPSGISAYVGRWTFDEAAEGVKVTLRHTAVVESPELAESAVAPLRTQAARDLQQAADRPKAAGA
ncbi:aromatase/cyclase [Amycolatopsis circi]|uniref:aromatase/cyclase n=1 Tax=Amycolatopsis circi TaxID=871959 RepID=UPI000E24340B|nr:aromatase/cyclase [Amycolatopsis circi]